VESTLSVTELRLFEPRSDAISFAIVRDEMKTVADLIQGIAAAQNSVVSGLRQQKRQIEENPAPIVVGGIDMREDILDGYESFHIPVALESTAALAQGAGILLVFAFLERSLRVICEELAGSEDAVQRYLRRDRRRSKVDGYLHFLREEQRLALELPGEFASIRESERKARNAFAHGDWDLHFVFARRDDALSMLTRLTNVFEVIEKAVGEKTTL
jgi:hypothetical protein